MDPEVSPKSACARVGQDIAVLAFKQHPIPHIRHRISGTPTVRDIGLALEYTLQHEDIPVLWDLRELELDEDSWVQAANTVAAIVNPIKGRMSAEKRVIVVADDVTEAGVELILGRLSVPWQWKIVRDVNEALAWLAE